MHIVFLQLFEQYQAGRGYVVERTLGAGLCKRGIAVPFTVYQKKLKEEEAKKEEKAQDEKKKKLLEERESEKIKKADSKKRSKATKAVKK